MLELEVLVCELFSVNGLSSGTIVVGEVTSLTHELKMTKRGGNP